MENLINDDLDLSSSDESDNESQIGFDNAIEEDAIEETNKIKELETEIIIESTKKKISAIEKEKINRINELEEDLRIETVKRKMKVKTVNFKIKNKEIARKK